jgi:hypothetical protein
MQRPQYLQSEAVSPVVTFIAEVSNIRREGTWIPCKSQSGAIGFALNFSLVTFFISRQRN